MIVLALEHESNSVKCLDHKGLVEVHGDSFKDFLPKNQQAFTKDKGAYGRIKPDRNGVPHIYLLTVFFMTGSRERLDALRKEGKVPRSPNLNLSGTSTKILFSTMKRSSEKKEVASLRQTQRRKTISKACSLMNREILVELNNHKQSPAPEASTSKDIDQVRAQENRMDEPTLFICEASQDVQLTCETKKDQVRAPENRTDEPTLFICEASQDVQLTCETKKDQVRVPENRTDEPNPSMCEASQDVQLTCETKKDQVRASENPTDEPDRSRCEASQDVQLACETEKGCCAGHLASFLEQMKKNFEEFFARLLQQQEEFMRSIQSLGSSENGSCSSICIRSKATEEHHPGMIFIGGIKTKYVSEMWAESLVNSDISLRAKVSAILEKAIGRDQFKNFYLQLPKEQDRLSSDMMLPSQLISCIAELLNSVNRTLVLRQVAIKQQAAGKKIDDPKERTLALENIKECLLGQAQVVDMQWLRGCISKILSEARLDKKRKREEKYEDCFDRPPPKI